MQCLATVRMDRDDWRDFKARARKRGTNASALVKRFIQLYMDGELKLDATHQLEPSEWGEVQARLAAIEQCLSVAHQSR